MKNKYNLLKILLAALVLVIAGVVYSCMSANEAQVNITDAETETEGSSFDVQTETADTETSESLQQELCVHVCGAVETPGVYYLAEGSRIHEAVEQAGGMTDEAAQSYVNLAEVIADGMQIYIPTQDEVDSGSIPDEFQPETDDGLVNINTASVSELMTLTGIGESKAEAIITYRENVSSFAAPEDITNVSGIGDSVYEKIKDKIKV